MQLLGGAVILAGIALSTTPRKPNPPVRLSAPADAGHLHHEGRARVGNYVSSSTPSHSLPHDPARPPTRPHPDSPHLCGPGGPRAPLPSDSLPAAGSPPPRPGSHLLLLNRPTTTYRPPGFLLPRAAGSVQAVHFEIMGVVNVTPDSFSDGGAFDAAEDAVAHGRRLAAEGAAILDVGGESTRPGADPVPAEEELRRVIPVVEGLARRRAGLDRHDEARGGRGRGRRGRDLRQRRHRLPARPGAGGLRRRPRPGLLPDAHARRAAHDAARPALRRRGLRRQGVPDRAHGGRDARRRARGADPARPRDRLRQDARAQPRAAAAAATS